MHLGYNGRKGEAWSAGRFVYSVNEVWIKRGEAQFGPLTVDDVLGQWEQGIILAGDEARIGAEGDWQSITVVLKWLSETKRLRPKPEASGVRTMEMASPAQVLRMRTLGVGEQQARSMTHQEADACITKLEAAIPAGRALLSKLNRMKLPAEEGITIAEARRRVEEASLRHYLTILDANGIPYTQGITAAQAEELAESGPPTTRQLEMAAEMELAVPPNTGQRTLDRYLAEAASAEANAIEEFSAVASRSAKCQKLTPQQVKNVLRYLNAHYPGWRQENAERRFFLCVAKFYPHLAGGSPTTRFLG